MSRLLDAYDAILFDLDGVLYVGPEAVEGASSSVAAVREQGVAVAFVTNNASRSPEAVAEHLTRLGIPAEARDVVTSAQAIAGVLADELETGAVVLVVGSDALADEVRAVGLAPTRTFDDYPVAVVQGYDPAWTIRQLQDCCQAVHQGLPWYASNDDLTIPTERGIMPGMGTWINVVSAATRGARPVRIAGKPHRPLLDMTMARLGCRRPLFVGDRLDTDVEGANAVGIDSLFVTKTGAHGLDDLAKAPEEQRPIWVGDDVSALLAEPVPAP